jgi:uncharacterized protein YkwD
MIRRVALGLTLLIAFLLTGFQANAETSIGGSHAEEAMICRIVHLTNQVRARYRLAPLQVHPALVRSARWMAQDMAEHDYLRHTDFLGREIDPRLPSFGYGDYSEIGENIAGGQLTAEEVVADWMRSPGHRANMLNPTFREIGVAHFKGGHSHFKHYWVQDFGVRSESFPVVINNKAPETTDTNVHLYLYGEGWAKQMRFSNDRIHWSDWETYRSRCDWTLNNGYGDRTVFAEVRGEGVIRRSTDTVHLAPSHENALIASAVSVRSVH